MADAQWSAGSGSVLQVAVVVDHLPQGQEAQVVAVMVEMTAQQGQMAQQILVAVAVAVLMLEMAVQVEKAKAM